MSNTKEQSVVIMHKGKVWQGLFFESIAQARNVVKWKFPGTKWKENQPNLLENARYGTKFEIIELTKYDNESAFY